jgi:hypothetical protein
MKKVFPLHIPSSILHGALVTVSSIIGELDENIKHK